VRAATYRHLHLGAGPLGLGLVAFATSRAGFDVVLASRRGDPDSAGRAATLRQNNSYLVSSITRENPSLTANAELVDVERYLFTGPAEDWNEILEEVRRPETILVTTALTTKGLEDCVPMLSQLLQARVQATDSPLFIIPCENQTGERYAELTREVLPTNIVFLAAVVDRVCMRLAHDSLDGRLHVVVPVEPFADWIIERKTGFTEPLEQILAPLVPGLVRFSPDIQQEHVRKLWFVNGVHTLVAIFAKLERHVFLDDFLATPGGETLLRGVQEELLDATQTRLGAESIFAEEDLRLFGDRIAERFRAFPDLVDRIIKRFTPEELPEFVKRDLHAKVVSAAELLFRHGMFPFGLTNGLFGAARLIAQEHFAR